MHYDGPIFRPPPEANTILLQVTKGCSHSKCKFCNTFLDTKFKISPMSEIEEDLLEIKSHKPYTNRLFLLGGDAFVLSFEKLKNIAIKIRQHLPGMQTITMYSRIQNIIPKSVEELKILNTLGISYLYVGVETGDDTTLLTQNKGYTVAQALEQLKKLEEAGIEYFPAYILGAAGKGNGERNALATAKFFNQLKPDVIWTMNLMVMPGTPLFAEREGGEFTEADELEKIKELKLFLENLETPTELISVHGSNLVDVTGQIPDDKPKMLEKLQKAIDGYDVEKMERLSAMRRL